MRLPDQPLLRWLTVAIVAMLMVIVLLFLVIIAIGMIEGGILDR